MIVKSKDGEINKKEQKKTVTMAQEIKVIMINIISFKFNL